MMRSMRQTPFRDLKKVFGGSMVMVLSDESDGGMWK